MSVLRLGPPSPSLPLEIFGNRWAAWIKDAAEAATCPPDYVIAALLPAASALIGHARWVQAWPGWQEPPHLWCASVGHSGQGKSPGADLILRHIIPSIEASMTRDAKLRANDALIQLLTSVLPVNDTQPAAMRSQMEPRFIESDITIEKVADVLANAAPKGLLMVRDELAGWLCGMNRFHGGARAFWLEAYGGRPYSVDRVKSTGRVYIPRLAVAWHGGIQPDRLRKLMTDADDGLLARFIWFWPKPLMFKRPKAIPGLAFAVSAFERLSVLDMSPGDTSSACSRLDMRGSNKVPIVVPLAANAAAQLEAFARQVQGQQFRIGGLLNSALGKARGLVLRLSLVIEFLRWAAIDGVAPAPAEISLEALQSAIKLTAEYVIPMAQMVYGEAATKSANSTVTSLAQWIVRTKAREVHVRTIQRKERLPGVRCAADVHRACHALVQAGWLVPPPRGSNLGRARQAYRVCPEIEQLDLSAESAESSVAPDRGLARFPLIWPD